jgi:hypothetical protein
MIVDMIVDMIADMIVVDMIVDCLYDMIVVDMIVDCRGVIVNLRVTAELAEWLGLNTHCCEIQLCLKDLVDVQVRAYSHPLGASCWHAATFPTFFRLRNEL